MKFGDCDDFWLQLPSGILCRMRFGYCHVVNNDYASGWGMYAIGGSEDPTFLSQGNRFLATHSKEVSISRDCWSADFTKDLKKIYIRKNTVSIHLVLDYTGSLSTHFWVLRPWPAVLDWYCRGTFTNILPSVSTWGQMNNVAYELNLMGYLGVPSTFEL